MPDTSADLWDLLNESRLLSRRAMDRLQNALLATERTAGDVPAEPLARGLVRGQFVTRYQAKILLSGRLAGLFRRDDHCGYPDGTGHAREASDERAETIGSGAETRWADRSGSRGFESIEYTDDDARRGPSQGLRTAGRFCRSMNMHVKLDCTGSN